MWCYYGAWFGPIKSVWVEKLINMAISGSSFWFGHVITFEMNIKTFTIPHTLYIDVQVSWISHTVFLAKEEPDVIVVRWVTSRDRPPLRPLSSRSPPLPPPLCLVPPAPVKVIMYVSRCWDEGGTNGELKVKCVVSNTPICHWLDEQLVSAKLVSAY